MLRVLFICLGNICRSPLAEGVFRKLVEDRGLSNEIFCDSAATHNYHTGALPDHRARRVAADHGINLTHKARRVVSDDFGHFDYLVAMDESILENLQVVGHRSTGFEISDEQLFLFRVFDNQPDNPNVPDPYYEDIAAFEEVYKIVYRCGENLLQNLVETHNLQA